MNNPIKHYLVVLSLLLGALLSTRSTLYAAEPVKPTHMKSFRGALLSAPDVTDSRLEALKQAGINAVSVQLTGAAQAVPSERTACERITRSGLMLYYWVEVARSPELADAHPEWMASLQGHDEWRRLFDDAPQPRENEVVKTYPWVTVLTEEGFAGQRERIENLLKNFPDPSGVFLNDIQGAPSACGCGNHLCRWTSDYGKIRTAKPLGNDAPARFVAEIQKLVPKSDVIPIWTTECEEHDKHGLCAGVGCFRGICWKAYTEQLMPVSRASETIGVLLPYKAFQRDIPFYGESAGWIKHAIKTFETMPPAHGGTKIPANRLLVVLEGWGVEKEQVAQQIKVAEQSGVSRVLIAYSRIEQSWEPRIFKWK